MSVIIRVDDIDGGYKVTVGKREVFVHALDDVSLEIRDNEILGIAGESGCGKSTLAKVIYGALLPPLVINKGHVYLNSRSGKEIDILRTPQDYLRKHVWWKEISYIPQNSMNVLNPMKRIRDHFINIFRFHEEEVDKDEIIKHAAEYLSLIHI